ncbi:MAG: SBBP repeat-containing protein [Candidatus Helarchaeota archaeon]
MKLDKRVILRLFLILLISTSIIPSISPLTQLKPKTVKNGLILLNISTTKLWQAIWETDQSDYAKDLEIGSDGNIYAIVQIYNSTSSRYNIGIVKYDSQGQLLWDRIYDGGAHDNPYGIALDSANNVYITGYTTSSGAGGKDVFLIKYDSDGNYLWTKTWGGSNDENRYGVAWYSDNSILIVGETYSFGAGSRDLLVLKYDIDGNYLWNLTWGGSSSDYGDDVIVSPDGYIYVVGSTASFGAGGYDPVVIKYDLNGTQIWNRTAGDSSSNYGRGVALYGSNTIIICIEHSGSYTLN